MHKIDGPGHAANTFTEGDPLVPMQATVVTGDWLNAIQDEVVNVVEGAGIVLDKSTNTQLRDAIRAMFLQRVPDASAAWNLGIVPSVAGNALTLAAKTRANANASADDPITIAVRDADAAVGGYNLRTITGALSIVVSSGSTLGHGAADSRWTYLYAIDYDAGTLELAVSSKYYGTHGVVSTTAEGGAGGADSATAMYSTSARANVPFRLIYRFRAPQTNAGVWADAPTLMEPWPFEVTDQHAAPLYYPHNTHDVGSATQAARDLYLARNAIIGGAIDTGAAAALSVKTNNGTEQFRVGHAPSADRVVVISGGASVDASIAVSTGGLTITPVTRFANGLWTGVVDSGGTGAISLRTNNGKEQFRVSHNQDADRVVVIRGSPTAATIDVSTGSLNIAAGAVWFGGLSTTASAANAFLDSGNNNNLLRSTSSLKYKRDVEPVEAHRLDAVLDLAPIWYRSRCEADRADWSWYGLGAEQAADVDPRLVHWAPEILGYKDVEYEETVAVTEEVEEEYVEVHDGKAILMQRTVERPVIDLLPLFTATGEPVMVVAERGVPARVDESGTELEPAKPAVLAQAMYRHPRCEIAKKTRQEPIYGGLVPDAVQYERVAVLAVGKLQAVVKELQARGILTDRIET